MTTENQPARMGDDLPDWAIAKAFLDIAPSQFATAEWFHEYVLGRARELSAHGGSGEGLPEGFIPIHPLDWPPHEDASLDRFTSASDAEVVQRVHEALNSDLAGEGVVLPPFEIMRLIAQRAAKAALTRSPAAVGGGMALEIAYTEARVWKVEAMAARELCAEWNELAKADGYGGGSVRAHDILEAMDKARAAHEEQEAADISQQAQP